MTVFKGGKENVKLEGSDFDYMPYSLRRPVATEIDDRQYSMDPSSVRKAPPAEEDEWDTDGFVIPSLGIEEADQTRVGSPKVEIEEPPPKVKEETTIYLGPHGAPPSQSKQDLNPTNRKQRLKQKLKEADRRTTTGRENKLENLRELVGGGKSSTNMAKGSSRDWLDPHCHEAEFEK